MGSDPTDEFQAAHPLQLTGLFPILVADFTFPFIEREPLHSALGHQEMQVGMDIYPGLECLDGRDDSRPKPHFP